MNWNRTLLFQVNELASKLEIRGDKMPEEVSFSPHQSIPPKSDLCSLHWVAYHYFCLATTRVIITSSLRIALPNNSPGVVTYVWEIVLRGCVIPRARADADARAFHATFQNDIWDISYI